MNNMYIYERVRKPPDEAQRPITAGRLKGTTDINPMWRIKALTEVFGPCGIGWNTINEHYITIPVEATKEIICIYELDLIYRRDDGSWSEPVHGIGGNMLVEAERNGLHANDEGLKMAKTDALSVAAKALGFAADIYWQTDRTKYGEDSQQNSGQTTQPPPPPPQCVVCGNAIGNVTKKDGTVLSPQEVAANTQAKYGKALCASCWAEEKARSASATSAE